ncbi:MAG: AMP-dependent synthetase and ligase [Gemmatimonadetes bacterium]|nr:AMP-dependent synthetase and ligase [Gemmatimonadota bacterium]
MSETVATLFVERVARYGDRPALRVLAAGGAPADAVVTWREWGAASMAFAAALVDAGLRPGECVAVLAGNGIVWPVADLGIVLAGGVSVGLYPTSPAAQLRGIVADSGAAIAVADSAAHVATLAEVQAHVPGLRTIILRASDPSVDTAASIDAVASTGPRSDDAVSVAVDATAGREPAGEVIGWDAWMDRGRRFLRGDAGAELERRITAGKAEDVAMLVYTSGSTGEPKGAMIPHRYLLDSALSIQQALGLDERDTSLSFLPFCHGAERVFGLYTRIVCGMEAGLVADHARVWEAARAFSPTVFGGLPRFFEKTYDLLRAEHEAAEGEERARWDRTVALGRARVGLRERGQPVPEHVEAEWREAGGPVFARARALFGGRVRRATSGGAPLPREVAEYLDAVGLPVLGAYGLTEHLCVAFNRPDACSLDAAGPPMPGTEIRIAADGEILVRRGGLTFAGYRGRPAETAASFTADGEWLLTGDLGELDARGMLRVTGRKKELIALSGGKKVAPLPIEARLGAHPWIGRVVLHGEGRRFISALVVLRQAAVESWARQTGIVGGWTELLEHPEIRRHVQHALDEVNAELSPPERVRRFALLERDLSPEADELTPTLKVKRTVVAERHRDTLDALYL